LQLAILNSNVLNYIYQKNYKSTKKVFSEIQARSVKELTIPILNTSTDEAFSIISNALLESKKIDIHLSDISTAIVFDLYFPDHMKERKIDILQFVEKDIEEVMQDKDFETLSDTNSEIVKRMNSFAEKSPEILKPILES